MTKLWGSLIAKFCLRFSSCATFGNSDFGNLGEQFEHVSEIVWTVVSVSCLSVPYVFKFLKTINTFFPCPCSQMPSVKVHRVSWTFGYCDNQSSMCLLQKCIALHWTLPPKQVCNIVSPCQIYGNDWHSACSPVSSCSSSVVYFASFVFLFFALFFYDSMSPPVFPLRMTTTAITASGNLHASLLSPLPAHSASHWNVQIRPLTCSGCPMLVHDSMHCNL